MKITDITSQKNKNKFNLFVDGQFYSGVLKETAIANNFFIGKNIDKDELDNILLESETKQVFSKATDYLASRLYSKKELAKKLTAKGFQKNAIDLALARLQEYGYIDDQQFASLYISQCKNKSKQAIKAKLIEKGIDSQTISKIVEQISDDQQFESALIDANKYLKGKDLSQVQTKLYASLLRKGYSSQIVKKVVSNVLKIDLNFDE